jgi:hypothetical protein
VGVSVVSLFAVTTGKESQTRHLRVARWELSLLLLVLLLLVLLLLVLLLLVLLL